MAKVNQIDVQMTFSVGLGNIDIPDEVKEQLIEIYNNDDEVDSSDSKYSLTIEWLDANIKDTDAYEWKYKLNELSE